MKMPRKIRAPTTPKNSTRCWYSRGTAKYVKMIAQMNTLSTARDFSIRYPAKYCWPNSAP